MSDLCWLPRESGHKDHHLWSDNIFSSQAPGVIFEKKPIRDPQGNLVDGLYSAWVTLNKQPLVGLAYASTESVDGAITYLHQFLPPKTQQLELPAPADGRKFSSARLLDSHHKVDLRQTEKSVVLTLDTNDKWDDVDTIIELK